MAVASNFAEGSGTIAGMVKDSTAHVTSETIKLVGKNPIGTITNTPGCWPSFFNCLGNACSGCGQVACECASGRCEAGCKGMQC